MINKTGMRMKSIFAIRPKGVINLICLLLLPTFILAAQERIGKTLNDLYPGLSSGVLSSATPAQLPKGTLLIAGALTIKESEISQMVSKADPAVRKQLSKNAFFLLENLAIKNLLLQEAYRAGYQKSEGEAVIPKFLSAKIKTAEVQETEIKAFYNENKAMFGNAPLEQARDMLREYLAQQKRQTAVQQYILTLGHRTPIQVNEEWVQKQNTLALDNPVDRARRSGKPTMVEFGATGCVPCDMMTPILADLRKKFPEKLNVLFVHVGQEQILGARFGIQGIPVQVFFDKTGREVFRHTGFFPQEELEKKMTQLGLI
jgi:thioredoxin 1